MAGNGVPLARLGDTCTHGATIVTASTTRTVSNQPAARLGDAVICPIHGPTSIVQLQAMPLTDNRITAHVHGLAGCGAVIITGSTTVAVGPS